jgi:phage FluMu gp28-like protein
MVLAQEARQEFGTERIVELIANDAWYREHSPRFRSRFEDKTILIPKVQDVSDDLRQIRTIGGVGKVPSSVRKEGTEGGKRHADCAIALMNLNAALDAELVEYGYDTPQSIQAGGGFSRPNHDDDHSNSKFGKGAW